MTLSLKDVVSFSPRTLGFLFERGVPPRWEQLNGHEFRGANLWLPAVLVGNRKFKKGFFERDGVKMGYNVRVRQNGLDRPWQALPNDAEPKRFGYYTVSGVDRAAPENRHPNALLLDYSQGGNGPFGPPLRDYLVQVDAEHPDLLLGAAYFALRPSAPSQPWPRVYFVLERQRGEAYQLGSTGHDVGERQPAEHVGRHQAASGAKSGAEGVS